MKEMIDRATLVALDHHDDGATKEYYLRLRERRRFFTTQCTTCAKVAYPPRPHCPGCFSGAVEWIDVGDDAVLHAFTTQQRGLRFVAPDVVGVVEIPGVGRVVTRIDAPFEALSIGMAMRFRALEVAPDLVVHSYVPA